MMISDHIGRPLIQQMSKEDLILKGTVDLIFFKDPHRKR